MSKRVFVQNHPNENVFCQQLQFVQGAHFHMKDFAGGRVSKLRPRPHVSGYFRIRNFFFPDTATVHAYPANSMANPEKNKSAPQSGKK